MKLEIELIPKTSWFTNLRSILSSSNWNKIKKIVFENANHQCEICGGVGPKWPVECHEQWEYDVSTNTQKLVGLIALDPACHSVKHIGLAQIQGRYEPTIKHFMKVNGLTRTEAEYEVNKAFQIWNDRNNIKWNVDISLLNDILKVDKLK